MYKKILSISLLLILAACGVSSEKNNVIEHNKNGAGFLGMGTKDDVIIERQASLKNINEVVIGSFAVGFNDSSVEQKSAKRSLMGGGSNWGGKASGKVRLEGVSDATKQAITDAAYNDFVNKLRTYGYTVRDRSALTSSGAYQSATKKTYPYVDDNSGFLSSYGQTLFFQPTALGAEGLSIDGAFNQTGSKMLEFAKASNIAVVDATYIVDFVATGGHSSAMSASIKVGQNLAVTDANIRFSKDGAANVKLGQPVESGQPFGTVINETTTTDLAVSEATNVARVLMGGRSSRSRNYVIQADPAKYQSQSIRILGEANGKMIAKSKQ